MQNPNNLSPLNALRLEGAKIRAYMLENLRHYKGRLPLVARIPANNKKFARLRYYLELSANYPCFKEDTLAYYTRLSAELGKDPSFKEMIASITEATGYSIENLKNENL